MRNDKIKTCAIQVLSCAQSLCNSDTIWSKLNSYFVLSLGERLKQKTFTVIGVQRFAVFGVLSVAIQYFRGGKKVTSKLCHIQEIFKLTERQNKKG